MPAAMSAWSDSCIASTKLDRLGRNAMDIRKTVELLSASEFEKNIRRHSGMG
ncbi:hypothetical protein PANT111_290005 [Pantoea brenneri]|uniref:Resolvase/invertase-type recombinase catalytic domain-containing protein n=1 Tax=Pantoea brenneri TaxID=472694 RepID=A0AAX3J986_9GAMM|nr:hypothetical protein PANT111_290005 [Pantoea brenneri]